jgi:hypothetical protein
VTEQPTPDKILQTGLAFWASKTLLSAIELGVFTQLAQGSERFETLSTRLGLHSRSARDFLDDDRSKNAFGLMMSLNMLIETPGGFDYTGADCAGWMTEAGFLTTRVEHLVGPDSMVVGIK